MAAPEANSAPTRAPGPPQPRPPRWTPYLCAAFALTVHALGGPFTATAMDILKVMSVAFGGTEGVTIWQIYYRLKVCPRNTNMLRTNSPSSKVQLSVCCSMAPPEAAPGRCCGSRLRAMPLLAGHACRQLVRAAPRRRIRPLPLLRQGRRTSTTLLLDPGCSGCPRACSCRCRSCRRSCSRFSRCCRSCSSWRCRCWSQQFRCA